MNRVAAVLLVLTARASAEPSCPNAHAFAFGTLTAPAGWCWQRTAEGDDLGGILVDEHGHTQAHYAELAHGARVGDACAARPERTSVRTESRHGVALRACEFTAHPPCVSFGGRANVCADAGASAAFSVVALARTLTSP